MALSMNKFIIFDNGGKTLDRFTIINKETGDVYGCGENSEAPNGVGQFHGSCVDHRIIMSGAGWRQKLPGKSVIKAEVDNYINNAKLDPDWMGNEVIFNSLPANVRQYISHLDSPIQVKGHSESNIVYMSGISEGASSGSGTR
jgi:hypothetical protein